MGTDKQPLFLLGGKDLEMKEIRNLLVMHGIPFVDKGLSWGALLSSYKEKFRHWTDYSVIYGVELYQDIPVNDIPDNYRTIDHHNQYEYNNSSLEQVRDILKDLGKEVEWTDRLKWVAANDKGHIAAMKAAGATDTDIEFIRKQDREAQGVTDEDYRLAEEAVKGKREIKKGEDTELVIIKSKTGKFSAITDLVYPWKRLLVYSETELAYYGKDKSGLRSEVKKAFELHDDSFYWGGGDNGYFGYIPKGKGTEDVAHFIENLFTISDTPVPHSKHIFLFPFTWDKGGKPGNPLDRLKTNGKGGWKRRRLPNGDCVSDENVYNELNFFYPFVHPTIYDKEGNSSNLWHFERPEADGRNLSLKYIITKKDGKNFQRYTLYIKSMNLNFYSTGVGLWSIYADNYDYPEEEDIISINQYGRRLFLPFYGDKYLHNETALSLRIENEKGVIGEETFESEISPNKPADFVRNLICNAVSNLKAEDIMAVLDDRMFVMSWYRCGSRSSDNIFGYSQLLYDSREFLYRYIFVDGSFATCQNDCMKEELLKNSLYLRWQKYGTLYGVSRYSFVMLTTPSCPDYLLQYFETMYVRMAELALMQRASILRFSDILNENKDKDFSAWYSNYIEFLNKFRFPEVSAQEQGIELYDMLCEKMRIKEHAEHLDNQFNEKEESLELKEQRSLSILAGIAVPVSIISAVFGFFFHDPFDKALFSWSKLHYLSWWLPGVIAIIISLVFTIVVVCIVIWRKKRK